MPRRTGQSSSSVSHLGFDTGDRLDDSVSTLRTSARILREIGEVLSKFPFVKPLAGITAIVCEIFEVRKQCLPAQKLQVDRSSRTCNLTKRDGIY